MLRRIVAAVASLCAVEACMASSDQVVLGPSVIGDFVRPEEHLPTLADLLTLETRASIFYSYSREVDIGARFTEDVDEGEGVTVFVPTNKAVQALTRKPNEDPSADGVKMSDAEHESISRARVRRWVGAHIIPIPFVDLTSLEPFETLTRGINITFKPANPHDDSYPADEPHTYSHAEQHANVKGPMDANGAGLNPPLDTDAAHLASTKGSTIQSGHVQGQSHPAVDTDASHLSTIKGSRRSSCSAKKPRTPVSGTGRVDTDAAHFDTIKGPVSPDRAPQTESAVETPTWGQYELNDGVHIIAAKKASNGNMYLIDGTVLI